MTEIAAPSSTIASTRSSTVSYGDPSGTTMTSGSSVSLAMGVMSSMRTSDAFVSTAPTITRPMTMSVAGSRSFASPARPTVPPAPGTFSTGADPTRSS